MVIVSFSQLRAVATGRPYTMMKSIVTTGVPPLMIDTTRTVLAFLVTSSPLIGTTAATGGVFGLFLNRR